MGADQDNDESRIAPGFEEQVRFLRKVRKAGTTRLQKTTEFNVARKLKREFDRPSGSFSAESLGNRLEQALNREESEDIFQESLAHAIQEMSGAAGKKNIEKIEQVPAGTAGLDSSAMMPSDAAPGHNAVPPLLNEGSAPASRFKAVPAAQPSSALLDEEAHAQLLSEPEEPVAVQPVDSVIAEFAGLAVQFKQSTGFDLSYEEGGVLALMLTACGDSRTLYRVPFNRDGINKAYDFAANLIEEYVASLSEAFAVEFSYPGEETVHQFVLAEQSLYRHGKILKARIPRIDELKALHRAIEFSWPAVFQADGEAPLLIVFIEDFLVQEQDYGVSLRYLEDGRPLLLISPELCKRGSPTDLDPIGNDNSESWQSSIMRELCWKSAVDCRRFPLSLSEYESLGWVPLGSAFTGMFAFRTRDGELYLPLDLTAGDDGSWVRCNEAGEFLNRLGEPCRTGDETVYLSDRVLAGRALVPPGSELFYTAEDEIVEALRLLRQGPEWRSGLARKSPQLYQFAKALDQEDINRVYRGQNGPGYIRSSRGDLVPADKENQKDVSNFEQKYSGSGKVEGKK